MTDLKAVFKNNKAFIPFVTAGDPTPEATVGHVLALAEGGADIVELGIPFSDPIADGPVIQEAGLRAFAGGITVDKVFDIVAEIRKQCKVPLVFLTYANIPFKYGYEKFCNRCADLEVSGLVIPDLPVEEMGEILPYTKMAGINIIPLVAPTSGNRIAKIVAKATGFVYIVSATGVTGQRNSFAANLKPLVADLRKVTDAPLCIGFGVHSPEQAEELSEFADGVIVGSAIVQMIKDNKEPDPVIKAYTEQMVAAIAKNN